MSRRASVLPYDGSEMILPIMMHSNAGTLRRDERKHQSILPYDGSEMILPSMMHSNAGTLRRDGREIHQIGTLDSRNHHHHCCTCDRTSYSTIGHGSSPHTKYSDL